MDALAGLAGFAALFLLVAMGVPIAFGMAFVGLVGFGLLAGWAQSINALSIVVYSNTSHFVLACIPLFILMGQFAYRSGIAEDLFTVIQNWMGAVPGGLAIATVFAAAGLGAVTGSSVAAVATMGAIALPELRRHGYDPGFAVGTVAAAGTLGILIPPSIPMVLYGLLGRGFHRPPLRGGHHPRCAHRRALQSHDFPPCQAEPEDWRLPAAVFHGPSGSHPSGRSGGSAWFFSS